MSQPIPIESPPTNPWDVAVDVEHFRKGPLGLGETERFYVPGAIMQVTNIGESPTEEYIRQVRLANTALGTIAVHSKAHNMQANGGITVSAELVTSTDSLNAAAAALDPEGTRDVLRVEESHHTKSDRMKLDILAKGFHEVQLDEGSLDAFVGDVVMGVLLSPVNMKRNPRKQARRAANNVLVPNERMIERYTRAVEGVGVISRELADAAIAEAKKTGGNTIPTVTSLSSTKVAEIVSPHIPYYTNSMSRFMSMRGWLPVSKGAEGRDGVIVAGLIRDRLAELEPKIAVAQNRLPTLKELAAQMPPMP